VPDSVATLEGAIQAATLRLRSAGIPAPRREALRLWADLNPPRIPSSLLLREIPVTGDVLSRFELAIDRRARGEPLAHLSGVVGFRRLTLGADRRALIPRPETEGLVDLVLERVAGGRVADIGTGSGCIGLSLADEGEFDLVLGVDASAEALTQAEENRQRTGLRMALVQGDLCGSLRPGVWDAIVSNPPYLTRKEYLELDGSVRHWEPGSALESGEDGLEATRRLIGQAVVAVAPGGWLALEVDCRRAFATAQIAAEAGWEHVTVYDDLFGRERYVVARRSRSL
jgi:release factor glutamine methyltransferase